MLNNHENHLHNWKPIMQMIDFQSISTEHNSHIY